MEKTDVVLVMLNPDALEEVLKNLDFDKVNLRRIVMDGYTAKTFNVDGSEIPVIAFAKIHEFLWTCRRMLWLIRGDGNGSDDVRKMRKFLAAYRHIPEGNIVNFEAPQISTTWLANLRYIEEHGADYFVTGNEYTKIGLNLNLIPRVSAYEKTRRGGVVLADTNQTLQQSYQIAKHVFAHVAPGTIKFVLIGLTPDSFRRDELKTFANCSQVLQYVHAFNEPTARDKVIMNLLNDDVKIFPTVTAEQADLNFDDIKKTFSGALTAKAIADWKDTVDVLPTDAVEKNVQILKDYIELCLANGAKPVGVIFPFAPAVRRTYDAELLKSFRATIHQLEENHDFTCVDMFELNLNYDSFCDMTHLNSRGQSFANAFLATKLHEKNLIPIESFCDMTYEYFNNLSNILPKDDYNAFMEKLFAASAEMIRRKDKIKIGFVTIDSAQWCGDDLYNIFAQDERFETTLFDCLRADKANNELVKKDFWHGVEQFKQQGLNIVAVDVRTTKIPAQDVIIFLTPYDGMLPDDLRANKLTAKTLITHITYSFIMSVSRNGFYNRLIFRTAWKVFFSSSIVVKMFAAKNKVGMPRGLFSGYPRMDIFFEQATFQFNWKMTRPDAKKIIYAPHWSINAVTRQATFQWNYKFMYEFAKNHPEISWVIKPHQALFFSTVREKVFPTLEAFEAYLQTWNDLPNAQVYTGAYYQALFATSDGMIHDSSSFIAEYQYVDKPMIFLTREKTTFNDLGKAILDVSYLVDGKDHDAIAAMIQRVFIEGDDYKAAERREVYDKYLNYPKANGMLASEFIYHSIADELKEAAK